jgi:hypothetical protein
MATAVQRLRAMRLYRTSLKEMLSWAVRREVFYVEVRAPARPPPARRSPPAGRRRALPPRLHPLEGLHHSIQSHLPHRLLHPPLPPLPRSQAEKLRARFEAAPGGDPAVIERSLLRGEAALAARAHPDPYITPYRPGGSLYARNPPLPEGVKIHLDFGREGGH